MGFHRPLAHVADDGILRDPGAGFGDPGVIAISIFYLVGGWATPLKNISQLG